MQIQFGRDYLGRLSRGDALAEKQFRAHFSLPIRVKLRTRVDQQQADQLAEAVLEEALAGVMDGEVEEGEKLPMYVRWVCEEVLARLRLERICFSQATPTADRPARP